LAALSRSVAVVGLVFGSVVVAACGRSSLDDGTVFPELDSGVVGPDGSLPDRVVPDTGPSKCGPANCAGGCCDNNGVCRDGNVVSQCGRGGQACQNCTGLPNAGCDAVSHTCTSVGGVCEPGTCGGCCFGNQCMGGASNTSCGSAGQSCQNCMIIGETCNAVGAGFQCTPLPPPPPPRCTPANCGGCCDQNQNCQGGFTPTVCGQGGSGCVDCTLSGSTCDVSVTPRVCQNMQNQCPSTYAGCPNGLSTPVQRFNQGVCSQNELQNGSSACSAGAHSTACQSFFSFEQMQNPSCAKCLSNFDFDFLELKGILECVSPFVNATCNHDIACLFDCATSSCLKCPDPPSTTQCQGQAVNGSCGGFAMNVAADQCAQTAAVTGGAFCLPVGAGATFGAWFGQVGARFCGP
jgi:hypothetical protein